MGTPDTTYLVWTRRGASSWLVGSCTSPDDAGRVVVEDMATCSAYWGADRASTFDWVIVAIASNIVVEDIDDQVENAEPQPFL